MNTLQLSDTWDLVIDNGGNIAMLENQSAIAQNVASAVRTFLGETWYDVELGIDYYSLILGYEYSEALVRTQMEDAALLVPGVVLAKATITSFTGRIIAGTISVIDTAGNAINLQF